MKHDKLRKKETDTEIPTKKYNIADDIYGITGTDLFRRHSKKLYLNSKLYVNIDVMQFVIE